MDRVMKDKMKRQMNEMGEKGIDPKVVQEALEASTTVVELTIDLTNSIGKVVCAEHKSLKHHSCIFDAYMQDAQDWMTQNFDAVMLTRVSLDVYFKELTKFVEKRVIYHLKAHEVERNYNED